jgi:ABC-type oligopeptide transport system substrate-binding subunit
MLLKKLLKKMFFGVVLSLCLLLGIQQNQVWAATATQPETLPNLESEVDQFLTSIPSGYYTISSVEKLKSLLI